MLMLTSAGQPTPIVFSPASLPGYSLSWKSIISTTFQERSSTPSTPAIVGGNVGSLTVDGNGVAVALATSTESVLTQESGPLYLFGSANGGDTQAGYVLNTPVSLTGEFCLWCGFWFGSNASGFVTFCGTSGTHYMGLITSTTFACNNGTGPNQVTITAVPQGFGIARIRRDSSNIVYLEINGVETSHGTMTGTFTITNILCRGNGDFGTTGLNGQHAVVLTTGTGSGDTPAGGSAGDASANAWVAA